MGACVTIIIRTHPCPHSLYYRKKKLSLHSNNANDIATIIVETMGSSLLVRAMGTGWIALLNEIMVVVCLGRELLGSYHAFWNTRITTNIKRFTFALFG